MRTLAFASTIIILLFVSDAPLRSDDTPSGSPDPAFKSTIAQNQPPQPQANIFQQVVDSSIKEGYVQKTQLDDTWVNVWVRPKFHWLDHNKKRLTAVAFLEWAKQQRPGVMVVFFFDSRDNKRLGR